MKKHNNQVISDTLKRLTKKDDDIINTTTKEKYEAFSRDVSELINKHSLEGESNTPDYILGSYLTNCLISYTYAMRDKEKHHNSEVLDHFKGFKTPAPLTSPSSRKQKS